MQDGIPRGAYQGTVQVAWNQGKALIYIVPAGGVMPEAEKAVDVDASGAVLTAEQVSRTEEWS